MAAVHEHRHTGDGTMTTAGGGNTAATYLTYIFGHGLEDDR